MTENEFLLQDRLGVIRDTMKKYGEENFYLSFSGGKDSTVVHHLLDMALPENRISRVFSNTGIEYNSIVKFVKEMSKKDDRIIMLLPKKNITKTLQEYGYPFKSKEYSNWVKVYQQHHEKIDPYFKMIEENRSLLDSYDFIHNLPVNVKYIICEYYGKRERERVIRLEGVMSLTS